MCRELHTHPILCKNFYTFLFDSFFLRHNFGRISKMRRKVAEQIEKVKTTCNNLFSSCDNLWIRNEAKEKLPSMTINLCMIDNGMFTITWPHSVTTEPNKWISWHKFALSISVDNDASGKEVISFETSLYSSDMPCNFLHFRISSSADVSDSHGLSTFSPELNPNNRMVKIQSSKVIIELL